MYMNNTVLIDSIETTLNYVIKMKKKKYINKLLLVIVQQCN